MSPTKQTLHSLVDMVDNSEIEFIYHMLLKLVPVTEPLPDEIEGLKQVEAEGGELVDYKDIDWE